MSKAVGFYQFPKNLQNLTLQELANQEGVEARITTKKVVLRTRKEDKVITIQVQEVGPNGYKAASISEVPRKTRKKDLLPTIIALKKQNKKQKDIAFELDVSEAYVSNLLKKHG